MEELGESEDTLNEIIGILERRQLYSLESILLAEQEGKFLPLSQNILMILKRRRDGSGVNEEPKKSQAPEKEVPVIEDPQKSKAPGKAKHVYHEDPYADILSQGEFGLEKMKLLLEEANNGVHKWVWEMTDQQPSAPYLIIDPAKEPPPPNKINSELPPPIVKQEMKRVVELLRPHRPKLAKMFEHCYPNTLSTTTTLLDDNTTYVITGDIDLMWLRDSSAQV